MSAMTRHAIDRVSERLNAAERTAAIVVCDTFAASHPTGSHAVHVLTLKSMRNAAWSEVSNGDMVVAIVRDGMVKTTMLRRHTQPWTPDAFNVDRVWKVKVNA